MSIRESISEFLSREHPSARDMAHVQALSRSGARGIVYRPSVATAHAASYYWVNYHKCKHSLQQFDYRPPPTATLRVLDVGCGSGAASAALVNYFRDTLDYPYPITLHAVDSSQPQLDLASRLSWHVLERRRVSIKSTCTNASLALDPAFDFAVFSFVLGELDGETLSACLTGISSLIDNGASVLVIDQAESGVFEAMDSQLSPGWPTESLFTTINIPRDEGCMASPRTRFSISARLITGNRIADGDASVLRQYNACWINHDTGLLRRLFAPHATYSIGDHRSFVGIGAIEAYWLRNQQAQRDVKLVFGRTQQVGNTITANWNASFDRLDLEKRMFLKGVMKLAIHSSQVLAFDEYYHKALQ